MKQTFDWLRAELNKEIEWYKVHGANEDLRRGIIGATNRALTLTNEAEKKWESDCCEWKHNETADFWEASCEHLCIFMADGPKENEYAYCPYCGRKILEVK